MKTFLLLGKLVTLLFWGVVLFNLYQPLAQPFELMLRVAGAALLALHVLELGVFNRQLKAVPRSLWQRLQVVLFGVFHVLGLPAHKAVAVEQPGEVAVEPELTIKEEAGNAENPGAGTVDQPAGTGSGGN